MKKFKFGILIIMIFILQACQGDGRSVNYDVSWGEYSHSAVERLEENNIQYEVNEDMIYIQNEDLNRAQSCCS